MSDAKIPLDFRQVEIAIEQPAPRPITREDFDQVRAEIERYPFPRPTHVAFNGDLVEIDYDLKYPVKRVSQSFEVDYEAVEQRVAEVNETIREGLKSVVGARNPCGEIPGPSHPPGVLDLREADPYLLHRLRAACDPNHPEHVVVEPKPQPELDERGPKLGYDDFSGDDIAADAYRTSGGARLNIDHLTAPKAQEASLVAKPFGNEAFAKQMDALKRAYPDYTKPFRYEASAPTKPETVAWSMSETVGMVLPAGSIYHVSLPQRVEPGYSLPDDAAEQFHAGKAAFEKLVEAARIPPTSAGRAATSRVFEAKWKNGWTLTVDASKRVVCAHLDTPSWSRTVPLTHNNDLSSLIADVRRI